MTDDKHAYSPDHANGEDFDITLNMEETGMMPPHPCQLTIGVELFKLNMTMS